MTKRKLVLKADVRAAQQALHDVYAGGELDDSQVEAMLEYVAPQIAARALENWADYFVESGAAVGIKKPIYESVAAIARRSAADLRAGK